MLYAASPRVEVVTSLLEGDAAELRSYHTENLKTCDALLFFWGEAGEAWLRSKLLDLRKAAGLGRENLSSPPGCGSPAPVRAKTATAAARPWCCGPARKAKRRRSSPSWPSCWPRPEPAP